MFRFEVGAHILVKRRDSPRYEAIEVEILAKSPGRIKAKICSDGWFSLDSIHWLDDSTWYAVGRVV